MQVIKIIENQNNIWNDFIAENNSECFLQSWEWGVFQRSAGKKVRMLAVFDRNKIAALALIIKNDLPYFGNYLYCPRGPVMDKLKYKNEKIKILEHLFNEIGDMAKKEKSVFLKIEPLTESDYELPKGFRKSNMDIQPKNTLMLDLSGPEENLMAGMKQKTRYNIRLAEKRGVKIRISSDLAGDFPKFWNLIEETSKRNNITSHSGEYYLKMLESLKENSETVRNRLFSRLYLAEYNGKVIASNIVLFFSDLAIYLHGASSDENKNVMAPYLLQWNQIRDAKNIGCKKYDFWGITIDGEKESWAGITRFKKGFGGFEKRYPGSFDLVYDKIGYFGYGVIKKVRKIL
ncbi:MAG: peptidoglycan bridge formation glycyltransferase FemA/FemB family protein [Candidatus Paceibacterota bacterium]|jgi:lipid II:glycine glycyltransferase (peptidoglycan interpeptide bridge formation enzyme)